MSAPEFQLYCDLGEGFSEENKRAFSFEELNTAEIPLPEGTVNVRLVAEEGSRILNLKSVRAYCGFWYDLSFATNGFRLGHNLFLLEQPGMEIVGEDFRYLTDKLCLELEVIPLSEESAEKLAHSTARLLHERDELEEKWKYQIKVYDDKVEEVVGLEADKVELNQAIEELRGEISFWRDNYHQMENSLSWRITVPVRSANAAVRDIKNRFPLLKKKKAFRARVREAGMETARDELFAGYQGKRAEFFGRNRDLEAERKAGTEFGKQMAQSGVANAEFGKAGSARFSLLCMIDNLSDTQIYEFTAGIMGQTFENFELCILDACDKAHQTSSRTLQWLAGIEPRIKVKKASAEFMKLKTKQTTPEEMIGTERLELKEQLAMASGDYIGFVDPEDELHFSALYECEKVLREKLYPDFIYPDSDRFTTEPEDADDPQFKPDYSPDYLNSCNYIGSFWLAKRELFEGADPEQRELTGNHYYGMILSLIDKIRDNCGVEPVTAEHCMAQKICHIPQKLYFEKKKSLSGPEYEKQNAQSIKALEEHFERTGQQIEAIEPVTLSGAGAGTDGDGFLYHIRYRLQEEPLITLMIPNKDHKEELMRCIDSVLKRTVYPNYEILIVENNSARKETFDYYKELEQKTTPNGMPIRVIQWKEGFNYSAINNFGIQYAKGEYVLLLNNDIEVITPDWIGELLMFAQRKDVGAAGAKLYYMDDTVQHAGVIIGLGGVAAHSHKDFPWDASGYMNRLKVVQNLSAVTAACLLMRKSVYEEIGGMDVGYQVAFNDADFCMRIREKGYLVVFTPFAEMHHDESKSRGVEDTPEKAERFESEVQRFKKEWPQILQEGDPYYNPNLTLAREDFSVEGEKWNV